MGRYLAHYDNPNRNGRVLTCILYLNPDWEEACGGALRLYCGGRAVEIAPLLDRLVVFWSDTRCPHEVLPAHATRYAITVWYYGRTEYHNHRMGVGVPDLEVASCR